MERERIKTAYLRQANYANPQNAIKISSRPASAISEKRNAFWGWTERGETRSGRRIQRSTLTPVLGGLAKGRGKSPIVLDRKRKEQGRRSEHEKNLLGVVGQ